MSAAASLPASPGPGPSAVPAHHRVVVFSDDAAVRDRVRTAVGRRPARDLGRVEWVDCATDYQVHEAVARGDVDLCVLDGEAWPAGGMGLCRELKSEVRDCPPVLVLVARRDDTWLASWSLADAVVAHPLDPAVAVERVSDLLRRRVATLPARQH